ncbi:MAG: lysozyme inhibitor LprI family protein [Thermodesulfobacteriota bacterium]
MLRKAIFLTAFCLMAGAGTVSADQTAWAFGPAAEKASELIPPLHSIDRQLAECMVKDNTTAGMTNCLFAAYDMWDGELNRIYKELRGRLQPEGQAALKATQSEWLQYRDLEFALIDSIYAGFEGTMYTPMRVEDRMNIVKNRVMELKSYIDLLEN